jgi:hypothetical protein
MTTTDTAYRFRALLEASFWENTVGLAAARR